MSVNSFHNDGILQGNLSNKLEPYAVSDDGNLIEAFSHPIHPLMGIQWHPEREKPFTKFNKEIILKFLEGNTK